MHGGINKRKDLNEAALALSTLSGVRKASFFEVQGMLELVVDCVPAAQDLVNAKLDELNLTVRFDLKFLSAAEDSRATSTTTRIGNWPYDVVPPDEAK